MSFRILFADDSMTAQNMGKKILTDAGYDVVAVSNGAAAVKKIAEQKPDIIILDIYMPGYSGLEVCDKVRASVDTIRTPVLLTVGKMEPYKPEDANRVRADGVIIKPFEASDLLAVIKKLEERVVPKTVAMTQETVLLERPPDFTEFEPEPEVHTTPAAAVQGTVDVPDNMATTAAFSDMLATESAYSLDPLPVPKTAVGVESEFSVEPPVEVAETPATSSNFETAPPQQRSVEPWPSVSSAREEVSPEPPVVEAAPTKAQLNGTGEWPPVPKPSDASAADTQELEVIEPPVETGFAAPEVSRFTAYHEPELPPAAKEPGVQPEPERIAEAGSAETSTPETPAAEPHKFIDPGLSIHAASFHTAQVEEENIPASASALPAEEPRVVAETRQTSVQESSPDAGRQAASSEDDFEARVAAAMSIYDEPAVERVEVESSVPVEPQPVASEAAPEPTPVVVEEVTPSFEYSPPIITPSPAPAASAPVASTREWQPSSTSRESMLIANEATMVIPVYLEPAVEQKQEESVAPPPVEVASVPVQTAAPEEPAPVMEHPVPAAEPVAPVIEQSVEARVEAALPAVAAAAAAAAPADIGANTQMITAVVDRILERLKPQMIEEISRELKQKK